jgi:nucleoside phosphorylase
MFDVTFFTALGWERRALLRALGTAEPGPAARTWQGRTVAGAHCWVVETGVGAARARAAAEAAPAARLFVACGCAGALAGELGPGDIVVADQLLTLDTDGRVCGRLPVDPRALVSWASRTGVHLRAGAIASSPVVLATPAAKAVAAATGALLVDMESAAVAAAARGRGIPSLAVRVVLDRASDDLTVGIDLLDPETGRARAGRVLARLAPRPWLWPLAVRLARRQRQAERALGAFFAAALGGGRAAFGPAPAVGAASG